MAEKDIVLPFTPSARRQAWIEDATLRLRGLFQAKGYTVPDNIRIAIGWPKGGGTGHKIGQCFYSAGSSDNHHEIFVSPELGNPKEGENETDLTYTGVSGSVGIAIRIMDVLAHELAHACTEIGVGHKKPFADIVTALGLVGKPTATIAGPEFIQWAAKELLEMGVFPSGKLFPVVRKTQPTRMIKCQCTDCGYVARTTRKWLDDAGPPRCAVEDHGQLEEAA